MYYNTRDKQGRFAKHGTGVKTVLEDGSVITAGADTPPYTYSWTDPNSVTVIIPPKRLFFDIETSPNTVYSWNVGRKINIDYDNIIQEREVICISYKWEHETQVHSLNRVMGEAKMLQEFANVINSADEIVSHNGDSFDVKWLRTRCLKHGVMMNPKFKSIDTLKVARKYFRFNSNRLNYLGQYLGVGQKIHTSFDLWKEVMNGNLKALNEMIEYCNQDVLLLEQVYNKLKPYMYEKVKKNKSNA